MKWEAMSAGRLERLTLLLTAVFGLVTLVWFLLPRGEAAVPTTVEPAHSLRASAPAEEPAAPGMLEGEVLDLNTAPAEDLTRLPGIGEKRAEDIVAWREEHGPFQKVEELLRVPGIGEKRLAEIRDLVTAG